MLNYLWGFMMLAGLFWAAVHGNLNQVTEGALQSAGEAVTLSITMLGIMSFWCGMMEVGRRAGLIERLSQALRPVMKFLFPHIPKGHQALSLDWDGLQLQPVCGLWKNWNNWSAKDEKHRGFP